MSRIARKRRNYASPGYRTGLSGRNVRKSRTRNGFAYFVRRYFKLISISFLAVVIVLVGILIFTGNRDTAVSAKDADVHDETNGEPDDADFTEYDDETLAGIEGQDAIFMDDDPIERVIEEGIRIGVTIGNLKGKEQETVINRLEEASIAAKQSKEIYDAFFYNANGSLNQQTQDVRSLINKDVDVIIVAYTSKENFNAIAFLAKEEGIPVVAYNAPTDSGYEINVVEDHKAWGNVYGRFMAENLAAGNVVQFSGAKESETGMLRSGAINEAFAANEQIIVQEPIYTDWNNKTAKTEAEKLFVDGKTKIDGVICEEGIATAVLDVFIQNRVLPKVMCGDVTAGFIKKWHALKNGGIDVSAPPAKKQTPPPPVMFEAKLGEFIVCAQPSATGGAAAAFDFALKIAQGNKLKTAGQTFRFDVTTLITDQNLNTYYSLVKDMDDATALTHRLTAEIIDAQFAH